MTLEGIRFILGDARKEMKKILEDQVQMVVTSPPYYQQRAYPGADNCTWNEGMNGALGLEKDPDLFVEHLMEFTDIIHDLLRDDGIFWLNIGDKYIQKQLLGIPWMVVFAMKKRGWILRSDIIWHKTNPVGGGGLIDRPKTSYDHIFMFVKSKRYYYDADGERQPPAESTLKRWNGDVYRDRISEGIHFGFDTSRRKGEHLFGIHPMGVMIHDVWEFPTNHFSGSHSSTFPDELVRRCISLGSSERSCRNCRTSMSPKRLITKEVIGYNVNCDCGDPDDYVPGVILDPFVGSGTTLNVSENMKRHGIGIDTGKTFYDEWIKNRVGDPAHTCI